MRELILRIPKHPEDTEATSFEKDALQLLQKLIPIFQNEGDIIRKIETYDPLSMTCHQQGYAERIDSITDAAKFLVNAFLKVSDSKLVSIAIQLNNAHETAKKNHNQKITSDKDARQNYYDYLQAIIEILKGNMSTQLTLDENMIAYWLDRAEQYYLLTKPQPILCTLIPGHRNNTALLIADFPLSPFKGEMPQPSEIPVCDIEKTMYASALSIIKRNEHTPDMLSLSSRLDTIPGVRNFRQEIVYHVKRQVSNNQQADIELELLTDEHRLSIIGTRCKKKDFSPTISKNDKENYKQTIANVNLQQTLITTINDFLALHQDWPVDEPIPALYQTLITPLPIITKKDYELYQAKLAAISFLKGKTILENGEIQSQQQNDDKTYIMMNGKKYIINILEANFPLNPGRYLIPTLEGTKGYQTCIELIKLAEKKLEKTENPKLQNLVTQLESILKMHRADIIASNHYHRELFIASLAYLIAKEVGTSFGGCISAKDREAAKMLHITAMVQFYKEHNEFPSFFDEPGSMKRLFFVKTMTDIFCSQHQQRLARFNANGANAIKTPLRYLPSDVCIEIETRLGKGYLTEEDKLASTNNLESPRNQKITKTECERLLDYLRSHDLTQEPALTNIADILHDAIIADAITGHFPLSSWGGGQKIENLELLVPKQIYIVLTGLEEVRNYKTIPDITDKLDLLARGLKNKSQTSSWTRQPATKKNYDVLAEIINEFNKKLSPAIENSATISDGAATLTS